MGFLSKIKNALFEEEEEEEIVEEEQIAKKIDIPIKESKVDVESPKEVSSIEEENIEKEEIKEQVRRRKTPVIFDVEDFIEDEVKDSPVKLKEPEIKKDEQGKILYGGYDVKEIKHEEKEFRPSPIISPVYGILDKNYVVESQKPKKSIDQLFVDEKKPKLDFDTVRAKAYGLPKEEKVNSSVNDTYEEDKGLLYEMESINDKPAIAKISLGDAEEYFEDLGLEYNVDYTDLAKSKMTRARKNKELTDEIDEEIKETSKIKKEIEEKGKKTENDIPEEKNLYDLIDMMYSDKEY